MADTTEEQDKPHEPTQKKLDDARRKGEVPHSADLTAAAAYGGLVIAGLSFGGGALAGSAQILATLLDRAESLSAVVFAGSGAPLSATLIGYTAQSVALWFALPAVMALIAVLGQRALVFAPSKLAPKLNRISLIGNAKQKFGRRGLFDFSKSFVKLMIYGGLLAAYLWMRLPEVAASLAMPPRAIVATMLRLSLEFLMIVLAIALALGGVDLVWQRAEHVRKNRMSRKELTDETKENEGDPFMKQERRQRGYDIATNRMLSDVPQADVVIVNPSHFAVALKWERGSPRAPVCLAKGVDDVARRIREAAAEAGVPIHRDPPTARALHASIDIGEEILPEHYRPVAAALRFAEAIRRKARERGW